MTGGVDFRPATLDDLDSMVAVFTACWRVSYAAVLPEPAIAAMTDDRALALWRAALQRDGVVTELAVRGAEVLGIVRYDVGEGIVHSLYVSPDAQGLGLGTALLDQAITAFRAAGRTEARLWVFEANAASVGFYGSRGWLPDGVQRVEEEFGEPELQLRKALS